MIIVSLSLSNNDDRLQTAFTAARGLIIIVKKGRL